MSKTILLGIAITTVTIAAIIALAPFEQAEASGPPVFKSRLTGVPSGAPAIHGMSAGAINWVVGSGNVVIDASGQMKVTVKGLLIGPGNGVLSGTTTGVPTVSAVLLCEPGGAASGTPPTPLSASGNAKIVFALPPVSPCHGPSVLILTPGGSWIAATGF